METNATPQPPSTNGGSVYDSILPLPIAYKPHLSIKEGEPPKYVTAFRDNNRAWDGFSEPPEDANLMPLVKFLRDGRNNKEVGWHRNEERRARGLPPIPKLQVQLESWERQLVSLHWR